MDENKINIDSNDKKENIDYSLYKDEPEKLFSLAKEDFKKNKFEEGIEILERSIELAIKKFGGEDKVELAQFYNKYSDGLIQKLMESNDDPLNFQKEESLIKNFSKNKKDSENKIDILNEERNKETENINIGEKNTEANEEIIEDEEIAFANLNAANLLLKNYLKDYDDKDPKTLDKSIIKYYLQLSDNYSLFASLEKINSDFKKADYYYKLSIDISKKYDNKFSRNLAGLYFEQAQILDFDPQTCLLSLYKSKVIMEHYLQMEIDKQNLKLKLDIDEKDLDLDSLSYDNEKIFKNKDLIMKNDELIKASKENCNIEEFVDIIKYINIKL